MATRFRCIPLPHARFVALWGLDDAGLAARHARRLTVDACPGFPCRLSLEDAAVGERVLLLPYAHLEGETPYRASGPVFVREFARPVVPAVDAVPAMLRTRRLSVRAYDAGACMRAAEVVEGTALEACIERLFADAAVAQLHVHFAGPGCYALRIERAVEPAQGRGIADR